MIYSKLEDGTIFCHTNKKMYRNYEEFAKDGLYELQQKVEQLENIRKEAIQWIDEWLFEAGGNGADMDYDTIVDLLNILNKGSEDSE